MQMQQPQKIDAIPMNVLRPSLQPQRPQQQQQQQRQQQQNQATTSFIEQSGEKSEQEKEQLRKRLKQEFPNVQDAVIRISLDKADYDEEKARELIKLLVEGDDDFARK